jgi:hypothetical protein
LSERGNEREREGRRGREIEKEKREPEKQRGRDSLREKMGEKRKETEQGER